METLPYSSEQLLTKETDPDEVEQVDSTRQNFVAQGESMAHAFREAHLMNGEWKEVEQHFEEKEQAYIDLETRHLLIFDLEKKEYIDKNLELESAGNEAGLEILKFRINEILSQGGRDLSNDTSLSPVNALKNYDVTEKQFKSYQSINRFDGNRAFIKFVIVEKSLKEFLEPDSSYSGQDGDYDNAPAVKELSGPTFHPGEIKNNLINNPTTPLNPQQESAWNSFWKSLITDAQIPQVAQQPKANLLDLFSPITTIQTRQQPTYSESIRRQPDSVVNIGSTGPEVTKPANTLGTASIEQKVISIKITNEITEATEINEPGISDHAAAQLDKASPALRGEPAQKSAVVDQIIFIERVEQTAIEIQYEAVAANNQKDRAADSIKDFAKVTEKQKIITGQDPALLEASFIKNPLKFSKNLETRQILQIKNLNFKPAEQPKLEPKVIYIPGAEEKNGKIPKAKTSAEIAQASEIMNAPAVTAKIVRQPVSIRVQESIANVIKIDRPNNSEIPIEPKAITITDIGKEQAPNTDDRTEQRKTLEEKISAPATTIKNQQEFIKVTAQIEQAAQEINKNRISAPAQDTKNSQNLTVLKALEQTIAKLEPPIYAKRENQAIRMQQAELLETAPRELNNNIEQTEALETSELDDVQLPDINVAKKNHAEPLVFKLEPQAGGPLEQPRVVKGYQIRQRQIANLARRVETAANYQETIKKNGGYSENKKLVEAAVQETVTSISEPIEAKLIESSRVLTAIKSLEGLSSAQNIIGVELAKKTTWEAYSRKDSFNKLYSIIKTTNNINGKHNKKAGLEFGVSKNTPSYSPVSIAYDDFAAASAQAQPLAPTTISNI